MTTRTRYIINCPCGHSGALRMSENDQPFSSSYESYSLEGLAGGSYHIEPAAKSWDEVFAYMKPRCPSCGTDLTPEHLRD